MTDNHFNQTPKRNASFIKPPNIIKAKVGDGGLSESILERAQAVLEEHATDFAPLAEIYLNQMLDGINHAFSLKEPTADEEVIALILFPCVQLKANGAMFGYPLITQISQIFVQFMEVVERLDEETLEIAKAFNQTIKLVITAQIKTDGAEQGKALVNELNNACKRYFEKHKDNIDFNKD